LILLAFVLDYHEMCICQRDAQTKANGYDLLRKSSRKSKKPNLFGGNIFVLLFLLDFVVIVIDRV